MAELRCPSCKKLLKFKSDLPRDRQVKVVCRSQTGGCGAEFFHPPIERSAISLRCAKDGRHLSAGFKRSLATGKFQIEKVVVAAVGNGQADAEPPKSYLAESYDWTNFYCPSCGYAPDLRKDAVVRCGVCSGLVCQGLTYDKLDGATSSVRWFVCHPECGAEGSIVGVIEEVAATRTATIERPAAPRLTTTAPPTLKIGNR